MYVSGNVKIGRIFREQDQMVERAIKIAKKTQLPVELRSYTFDGFGRKRKGITFYEAHVLPDGRRVNASDAKEWFLVHNPDLLPDYWQ